MESRMLEKGMTMGMEGAVVEISTCVQTVNHRRWAGPQARGDRSWCVIHR